MYKIFVISLLFIFPSVSNSFQGAGCGKDCASCHYLSNQDAGKILKIEVSKVSQSPVKGLWEIEGMQAGKKVKAYLDYGKKYIVAVNAFIPVESIGEAELKKLDISSIPMTGGVWLGDAKAKHKVIVFDDPDCPYCRKLHTEIESILKKRKDIAFFIKLFPLVQIHPQAYEKSRSIICRNSSKLLDDAFEGRDIPKADCQTGAIDDNIKTAEKLGIGGTPAIVLPDGRLIPGFVEGKVLLDLIDEKGAR